MPAGTYIQATMISPHAVGSEEEKAHNERVIQIATESMVAALDPAHSEPRRMVGVYYPIKIATVDMCCQSGDNSADRDPPTMCEGCADSWREDYILALFRHGTLRGVAYGCTCTSCMAMDCRIHPGDNVPLVSSDIPDGGKGTYPGE